MSFPLEQWINDEFEKPDDDKRHRLSLTSDMLEDNKWVITRYWYSKQGQSGYKVVFTGEHEEAVKKYHSLSNNRLKDGYRKIERQLTFCF